MAIAPRLAILYTLCDSHNLQSGSHLDKQMAIPTKQKVVHFQYIYISFLISYELLSSYDHIVLYILSLNDF